MALNRGSLLNVHHGTKTHQGFQLAPHAQGVCISSLVSMDNPISIPVRMAVLCAPRVIDRQLCAGEISDTRGKVRDRPSRIEDCKAITEETPLNKGTDELIKAK